MQPRKHQKTGRTRIDLFHLPQDIVMHLLRFCELNTLVRLERTCANGAGFVQEALAQLKSVDLTQQCLYSQEVRPLLRKLSSLTSLRLDCLHVPLEELQPPPSLQRLYLILCGEDFEVDLPRLFRQVPQLTYLKLKLRNRTEKRVWTGPAHPGDFHSCSEVSSTGLCLPGDFPVTSTLSSLKLRAVPQCPAQMALNDTTLQLLTRCCPALSSLCITDYTNSGSALTDAGLRLLAKRWPHIWRLRLSSRNDEAARHVSDLGLMSLLSQCSSLQDLALDSFKLLTDATLAELAVACPSLHTLSLDYTNVTGEGLQLLSGLRLRKLSLKGCRRVREEGLLELLRSQSALLKLNLSCTNGVTDSVVEALRVCEHLTSLTLNEGLVTDGIFDLLSELPLKALAVNYCSELEQLYRVESLGALSLRRLSLVGYPQLTETDVLAACSGSLDTLLRLRLDKCRSLGDSCLLSVLRSCARLQQLYMYGCQVSSSVLSRLPKLRNMKVLSVGVEGEVAAGVSYEVD